MRIVSFLPAATEMVYALGLEDQLVGVTQECDYPADARRKPIVVGNAVGLAAMKPRDIDTTVRERVRNGQSLYRVDEARLRELAPDLILTQDLCQVCAPSGNEISQWLPTLPRRPEILWMTPRSLSDIDQNLRDLGRVTGRGPQAEQIITVGHRRLAEVKKRIGRAATRPRVFCMEWVDPMYSTGHWVPEMVALAGGEEGLAQPGGESVRLSWETVLEWNPDVLVIMPCGFTAAAASEQARALPALPRWNTLSAVRHHRVFAVDANAYFARPGPRVIEGTELLAHLIHPDGFPWDGPADAFISVDL